MANIPITPNKPVGGNFAGSFSGFLAFAFAGYVAKQGLFHKVAALFCSDDSGSALLPCDQSEWMLLILFAGFIGSLVNYLVTHFAQVKKLQDIYDKMNDKNEQSNSGEQPKP